MLVADRIKKTLLAAALTTAHSLAFAASPTARMQVQVVPAPASGGGGSNGGVVSGVLVGIDTGCSTLPGTNCSPDNGGEYETPRLNQQVNRYPDFAAAFTGSGPCAGPSACGGGAYVPHTQGYPFQGNFSTLDNWGGTPGASGTTRYGCSFGNYAQNFADAAAASPAWVQAVDNALQADFAPYAGQMYAMRVNWEWNGTWFCWSPWIYGAPGLSAGTNGEANPSISAATWSAATVNTIHEIRKILPGVKVFVDGPMNVTEQAYVDPVAAYADGFSFDVYFSTYQGATSELSWQAFGGDGGVPYCRNKPVTCTDIDFISSYAAAHGKPLFVGEWADTFNDGVIVNKFSSWMVANNVVAQSYWDSEVGCPSPSGVGCHLLSNPAALTAYRAFWGGVAYTGSYWAHKAIPPAISDGIGY